MKRVQFRVEIYLPDDYADSSIESAMEVFAGDFQFEVFKGNIPDDAKIITDSIEVER